VTAIEVAAIVDGMAPAIRALVLDEVARAMAALDVKRFVAAMGDLHGPAGPPGRDGVDGVTTTLTTTVVRFVCPWADDVEYHVGDLVSVGARVFECTKATTVHPTAVTRSGHGDARGPQGKDFWTPITGSA